MATIITQTRHKPIMTMGEIRLVLLYLSRGGDFRVEQQGELKELLQSIELVLFLTLIDVRSLPAAVPFSPA
jgi:hypothetical protein